MKQAINVLKEWGTIIGIGILLWQGSAHYSTLENEVDKNRVRSEGTAEACEVIEQKNIEQDIRLARNDECHKAINDNFVETKAMLKDLLRRKSLGQ